MAGKHTLPNPFNFSRSLSYLWEKTGDDPFKHILTTSIFLSMIFFTPLINLGYEKTQVKLIWILQRCPFRSLRQLYFQSTGGKDHAWLVTVTGVVHMAIRL